MNVEFKSSFRRDLKKVKDDYLLEEVKELVTRTEEVENLFEMPNTKKLGKSRKYYRIRLGDYRIGIKLQNEVVTFVRFVHRKDIYKYFP